MERRWRYFRLRHLDYRRNTVVAIALIIIMCISGIMYIRQHGIGYLVNWNLDSVAWVGEQVEYAFVPQMALVKDLDSQKDEWIVEQVQNLVPILKYYSENSEVLEMAEDTTTEEWILLAQAMDENSIDEEGELVGEEVVILPTTEDYVTTLDMELLTDFDYVLSNYYVVDKTVSVDEDLFNMEEWLEYDLSLEEDVEGPQILIYHTHSQEEFIDSVEGDLSTTIVGVGAYLAEVLTEEYGVEVLHHEGVYDLVNGVLDRSNAYELAYEGVSAILEENPSIEFVIDLHRDGVLDHTQLVTMIDGEPTAQIMFFNGLSSTLSTGDIDYLYNPYIDDNLALTFQMQVAAEEFYPGFSRRIYLKSYRYNLHLMPKTMLIEAGAQTNSLEEMFNAMDVLAEILSKVLDL